jgi:hypothetical protein
MPITVITPPVVSPESVSASHSPPEFLLRRSSHGKDNTPPANAHFMPSPRETTNNNNSSNVSALKVDTYSSSSPRIDAVESAKPIAPSTEASVMSRSTDAVARANQPTGDEEKVDDDNSLSFIGAVTIKCLEEDVDQQQQLEEETSAINKNVDSEALPTIQPIPVTPSLPPLTSSRKARLSNATTEPSTDTESAKNNNSNNSNNSNTLFPPSPRSRRHTDTFEVSFVEKLRQQAEKEVGKSQLQQQQLQQKEQQQTVMTSTSGMSGQGSLVDKVERRCDSLSSFLFVFVSFFSFFEFF